MPGKAQRTKGNLKPSSSSQAVQLLAQSGHAPVGFIGFGSQPAFVPASEIYDDSESVLDADFRLVLRKLSKKDTVTKIKALQEFISLCGSKDDDSIKAVVSFWPRIYCKVSIDVDHKVRELSQKALQALAEKVGKNLSPHLRGIMGAWMVCMCDTYPTVASAASAAFSSVFPPAKQAAAIRFCKSECAEYFLNNVTTQTPQTLSDPLTTSQEDMTAKYHRVVTSSCLAMRSLLSAFVSESQALDSLLPYLSTLLGSAAFWKHAKSSVSQINGAALSVLSSVCQHCPSVSAPFISKIAPLVFSFLDSKDPGVVSPCWEALLSLINSHDDCWQHVNWQKAVWPKLKTCLETGCCGHPEVVGPCLLPLLSKLPRKAVVPFFDSLRLGLNQEAVANSPISTSALVKAFMECVHYAVKTAVLNTEEDCQSVIQGLVHDQVLVVVEASLTDSRTLLTKSPLYALLSSLTSHLEASHGEVMQDFWRELSVFTCHHILAETNSVQMETPTDSSTSTQQSVLKSSSTDSFLHRLQHLVSGLVYKESSSSTKDAVGSVKFQHNDRHSQSVGMKKERRKLSSGLENYISDILVSSFYLATKHKSPDCFRLFKDVAVVYVPTKAAKRLNDKDDHLLKELEEDMKNKNADGSDIQDSDLEREMEGLLSESCSNSSNEHIKFVYSSLLKLLFHEQRQEKCNLMFTEQLIVSSFAFLHHFGDEDAAHFLSTAMEGLTSVPILCQFIELLIRNVSSIPACEDGLNHTTISNKITEIATGITHKNDGQATENTSTWRMFLSYILQLGEGPVISNPSLDMIVKSCVMTLELHRKKKLDLSLESSAGLMSVVHTLFQSKLVQGHAQFSELLSSVLMAALGSTSGDEKTGEITEAALTAAFKLVVSDLPIQSNHLYSVCKSVRGWVANGLKTVNDLGAVGKVVKLLVSVIVSSRGNEDGDERVLNQAVENSVTKTSTDETLDNDVLDSLLYANPVQVDQLRTITDRLYLDGKLNSPEINSSSGTKQLSLAPFSLLNLYNSRTLREIIKTDTVHDCSRNGSLPVIISEGKLSCLVSLVQFVYLLNDELSLMKQNDLAAVPEEIHTTLRDFLSRMTQKQLQALVDFTIVRSESSSRTLALAVESCLADLLKSELDLHSKRSVSDGLQRLQTRFLYRCLSDQSVASRISSDLAKKAKWSGADLSDALSSASSSLLSQDVSLEKTAECLSGFVELFSNCDASSSQDRQSFFQQVLKITTYVKENGFPLLTGSDVTMKDNVDVLRYNACVARAVMCSPCYQHEDFWDFTLCTSVEWIQFLAEADISVNSRPELQALMAAVCRLASFVACVFANSPIVEEISKSGEEGSSIDQHQEVISCAVHRKTKTEWDEFFSEGLFSPLLPKFVSLSTEILQLSNRNMWSDLVESLASAVILCPANHLTDCEFPARLTVTDNSGIADDLKSLLNHLCPLLNSPLWKVQVSAFSLLNKVMAEVSKQEAEYEDESSTDSEEDEARSPPEALCLVVEGNAVGLDALLMTEEIESDVGLEVGSQEHSLAIGYLLAWGLQLQLFRCASNELRAKFAQFFKNHDSVRHLCDHLFRLMPSHPSPSMTEFQLSLDGTDEMKPSLLGSLAMRVYAQCLEVLPAMVRAWWVDQNRKASNYVDRFTTQYISNSLCVQQLTSSEMSSASIEDITIRPRPAAREVSAVYEMAEVTVNMTIRLPENYPLGKVDVSCDKRVGVSQAQWDKWLLQLNIFLQHQNGSIVEGLRLWKGNMDKRFEGIDDCMICFSVIHGSTFQLPRLTCRTCRKKFHSSCLYKWFNTSQKSSCPLCRNLF